MTHETRLAKHDCSLCGRRLDPFANATNEPVVANSVLFVVSENGMGVRHVFLSEVHAVVSSGRVIQLRTERGDFTTGRASLKDLERLNGWLRVHRSCLVRSSSVLGKTTLAGNDNASHHKAYHVVVKAGKRVLLIPISRRLNKKVRALPLLTDVRATAPSNESSSEPVVEDLVILVKRLVNALRTASVNTSVIHQSLEYLDRIGKRQSAVLRQSPQPSTARAPNLEE